jgi:hypothetical protein
MASKDPRSPSDAFFWRRAPKAFLTSNGRQRAPKKLLEVLGPVPYPDQRAGVAGAGLPAPAPIARAAVLAVRGVDYFVSPHPPGNRIFRFRKIALPEAGELSANASGGTGCVTTRCRHDLAGRARAPTQARVGGAGRCLDLVGRLTP